MKRIENTRNVPSQKATGQNAQNTRAQSAQCSRIYSLVLLLLASALPLAAVENGLYLQSDGGSEIFIIDRDTLEFSGSYSVLNGSASLLVPTPGGASVYVLSNEGRTLEAFSAETGIAQEQFGDNWQDIRGIAFTPRGERLFVLDRAGSGTSGGSGASAQLIVYNHNRLSLERSTSIDFPLIASDTTSGSIVFNDRGTRYFALGSEAGEYFLMSGDGVSGRIYDRLALGFAPSTLRLSDNDRYAWLASTEQIAVVDLRRNRILRRIQGNFNAESLQLEAQGNRAIIVGAGGIHMYNMQNGRHISTQNLPAELAGNYASFVLDENDRALVIPRRASADMNLNVIRIEFAGRRGIQSESLLLASVPADGDIAGAVLSSLKRGQNFACF